jgi:hypothetical protein
MTSPGSRRPPGTALLVLLAAVALVATACQEPERSGSPVCRRGSPRITVYQGPDGDCIPRRRVVGYRCEDADPVVVFGAGSGSERRFLGGPYTVPVPRLPDDAQVIGVGDGAQLVAVPDDPRRLFTVRGSSVWRWLALPAPSSISGTPRAFMLGDSLLDGGTPAMIAALPDWSLEIDATNGRGSITGASIAEARTAEDQVVVVELGTNDRGVDAFTANADRILSAFRRVPLVLWQNVEGPPDIVPADEINAAIETLAGRRPNVAIADWDEEVPEEYLSDGVHPDPEHQDAMATLVAPMLQRWWTAATEQPACD